MDAITESHHPVPEVRFPPKIAFRSAAVVAAVIDEVSTVLLHILVFLMLIGLFQVTLLFIMKVLIRIGRALARLYRRRYRKDEAVVMVAIRQHLSVSTVI